VLAQEADRAQAVGDDDGRLAYEDEGADDGRLAYEDEGADGGRLAYEDEGADDGAPRGPGAPTGSRGAAFPP